MTGVLLVVLLIVIVAVVAIAGALIAMYNGLVKLNIKVEEAWSGITVQLKRRADLIPNLVETVKGYAAHEKGV
ncbi:LemA family protein, partial [TM7 phylum sp. oral taxon 349]